MPYHVLIDTQLNDEITAMIGDDCVLHLWQGDATDPAVLAQIEGYFTYGHPKVDGAVMDKMPNLRIISNFGVGVDHITLPDAQARGIPVGNTPNLVDGATADMAFALLMAAARNLIIGDHYARSPEFTHYDPSLMHGYEVHSATLGIIGMGNIGTQLARRAQGFDMRVLYHNRNRRPQTEADLGVIYTSKEELLRTADFVAITVPMTAETRHIIGRAELRLMKPTAILINVARGGVLDHDALVEALQNQWIYAAAVDVTEPEPLPRDHPLLKQQNLVIAPHLGSATRQTRRGMAQRSVDNLKLGLRGEPLINRVV
ncbi:MAG: D-glycerate dehydrogenase [Caldilineaceae bacterium]|nr:D-glycerate dehydrogenase [Caldilineaceae bacterium]